jgi:hypothetical protein
MDVMTAPAAPAEASAPPFEGYDEDTVDDFVRAVSEEQARLRAQIEEARVRETRALALLGMHDGMLATMSDVYREITARRREAEATAAATVRDARTRIATMRADAFDR